VTTHVMLTDVCNHTCAFCSVQARAGDSLPFDDVMAYLDILLRFGLKAVILSGGGNPILYRCKKTGKNFNDVVDAIHSRGLEIGLITNGTPLVRRAGFKTWKGVKPITLDKLTWIRISMAGLDHEEREVYVPDIDPTKTTLGFSYVGHDIYTEPADPHHGKVSTPHDLLSGDKHRAPDEPFESRIQWLTEKITHYVLKHKPKYVRLLPNCLEPELIPRRCEQLNEMARCINLHVDDSGFTEVAFVQQKPPRAPKACYLGYIHPVLNSDGFVFPCDSCVLNESAEHKFANPWRVCHWSEVAKLYTLVPVKSLIADPAKTCPGCVFHHSNEILRGIVEGDIIPIGSVEQPEHVNFV